jgi:hypothetical protein
VGVGITAALWSDCNWGGGDVDIDVDRYNEINRNTQIDRSKTKFEHNAGNRRGVPYRDSKSRQQYGKNVAGAAERSNYRGHDPAREAQRQRAQISMQERGMDPAQQRAQLRNDPQTRERAQNAARDAERGRAAGSDRQQLARADSDRAGGVDRDRQRQADYAGGGSDSALRDAGNGREARQQFDRGSASRQSVASRSSGFSGRAGGGGGRAGGGGRGGGGRR